MEGGFINRHAGHLFAYDYLSRVSVSNIPSEISTKCAMLTCVMKQFSDMGMCHMKSIIHDVGKMQFTVP